MLKDRWNAGKSAKLEALTHPTRQEIINVMLNTDSQEGTLSPRALASQLGKPLPNISYHVRVLADCGAIVLKDTRQVRGSLQHFYSLSPQFVGLSWIPEVLKRFVLRSA